MQIRFSWVLLSALAIPAAAQTSAAPSKRHEFSKIDPAWEAKTKFLRPQSLYYKSLSPQEHSQSEMISFEALPLQLGDDAFIVVNGTVKRNAKTDWKTVSYSEKLPAKAEGTLRKKLCYSPNGRLVAESDVSATDTFSRRFATDGSVVAYEHTVGTKSDAGWSISPDRKTVSHFEGGEGDWIEWSDKAGDFTHFWYHEGTAYLVENFQNGKRLSANLGSPQDGYLRTSLKGEELNLFSLHEVWSKTPNTPVQAQVMDFYGDGKGHILPFHVTDDEVKKHIRSRWPRFFSGSQSALLHEQQQRKAIQQQLEGDYLHRRADFLVSYEKVLRAAGQTWHSVGLDDLSPHHTVEPS